MVEETIITEEAQELSEERKGSGRGFVFGITLGALAGAAAATLLAPATGEEIRQRITDEASPMLGHPEAAGPGEGGLEGAQPGTPVERIRAVLARVRSRVQEASEEGRLATQEAVEESRTRYAELTHQEEPQV